MTMSRYIDADHAEFRLQCCGTYHGVIAFDTVKAVLNDAPSIDIVRCQDCKKSHIDGKTTHYLWCTEWGRSTDTFGYCERGEREGE